MPRKKPRPTIAQFPIRVLSLGAGVQSSTLLLMMLKGQIPRPDHVVFSDTGWEPKAVYQHLDYLKGLMEKENIPFHVVRAGNLREDFMTEGARFASMPLYVKDRETGKRGIIRRQCTADYKIDPVNKKLRELAELNPRERCQEHRITVIIGISLDESIRMRDPEFNWIKNDYPLVDMGITRQDCIKWCGDNGFPRPPKSACVGCPFKSIEEWLALKEAPDQTEWLDAVAFDKELRTNPRIIQKFKGEAYLHYDLVPLDEIDFHAKVSRAKEYQPNLFDQDCAGMCGI